MLKWEPVPRIVKERDSEKQEEGYMTLTEKIVRGNTPFARSSAYGVKLQEVDSQERRHQGTKEPMQLGAAFSSAPLLSMVSLPLLLPVPNQLPNPIHSHSLSIFH